MAAASSVAPLPLDDATLSQLAGILEQTLNPNDGVRAKAQENLLRQVAPRPQYAVALLNILKVPSFSAGVKQQAAIQFKNHIKKYWAAGDEADICIPQQDRGLVKQHLINLMAEVPKLVRLQLGEAVGTVANADFPDNWPNLCQELVARLDTSNMDVTNGMLAATAAAFSRFDGAFDSDAVRYPLVAALEGFQRPLTELFHKLMQEVASAPADAKALTPRFQALATCCRIFYCLNYIELPEFFLDNMQTWVAMFLHFLSYSNAALEDPDELMVPGPVETLQTEIMACMALYAEKFDDDFEEHIPKFVDATWKLLQAASAGSVASVPKYDGLVTQAIRFLSSVVSKSSQAQLFANPATLQAMCQSAVLPNMALREADEIAFEENPKEYIMRDIEGSSSETRRAAASKMIKGLLVSFSQDVTKLCMGLVDSLMQEYATAPDAKWKEKDAGLALLSALAGLTSLRSKGVQELNPQVDIVAVLKSYIIPELHLTGSEAAKIESTLPTGAAIIKCTCLNFITAFRQHWSAAVMTDLAPLVAMWLKSPMVVVHSYAAVCLERMLTVKEAAQGSSTGTMRVPAPTVKAILNLALSASLQRVAAVGQAAGAASAGSAGVLGRQDGNGENEWMMRLVLRMLVAADTDAAGVIGEVLQVLVKVAEAVLSNPAAPNFNHHMFEAVAVLIKIAVKVHAADPAKVSAAVDELEGALMPLFNTILQKDVTEFVPYVFQLLASLQAHKPAPQPGQHTLSAGMQSLATSLVQASLWERKSNIPALCMLMTAVLAKGAAFMVAQKKIMPVLGVFQKLMSAASTEDYAHHLLRCVILYVPMEVSQASLPTALSVILTRMQTKGSVKTAKAFVVTMCLIANKAGGATAVQLVEAIQPGLFTDLLTSVVLPHANAIIAKHDRRTVIAGLAALAGDVEALLQPANLPQWQAVASVIVQLLEAQADTAASAQHAAAARVEAALESADAAPAGFDTKFSRLAHVSVPGSMQRGGVEYISAATDLRACWIEKLKGVVQKVGVAQWPALTSQMEAPIAGVLKQYLASAGVTVS